MLYSVLLMNHETSGNNDICHHIIIIVIIHLIRDSRTANARRLRLILMMCTVISLI